MGASAVRASESAELHTAEYLRVRALAQAVARAYYEQREKLGFPGAKKA